MSQRFEVFTGDVSGSVIDAGGRNTYGKRIDGIKGGGYAVDNG